MAAQINEKWIGEGVKEGKAGEGGADQQTVSLGLFSWRGQWASSGEDTKLRFQ